MCDDRHMKPAESPLRLIKYSTANEPFNRQIGDIIKASTASVPPPRPRLGATLREERLAAQRRREEATRRDAQAIAARLHGQTLRFTARVGELDRLYGSITSSDIAGKIGEILGVEFDRRKIQLEEPIKRIGIYPVTIRLMAGVEAVINVVVEGEEGAIQLPPDPETV